MTFPKKSLHACLFLILSLALTGCIRVETILFINKDGSGTITEKVMVSKTFVEMLKSFRGAFEEEGKSEPFSLLDEDRLREDASSYGEGVTYRSSSSADSKDWEGYTVTYSFADVTKIRMTMDQDEKVDTGMPSGDPFGGEEPEEVTEEEEEFYYFGFEGGSNPVLTINRKEAAKDESEADVTESENEDPSMGDMNEEVLKMFDGMGFKMAIVVDGKITETNASFSDKSTVTLLDMDFSEMMKNKEAFVEMTKAKPETAEEMKAFMDRLPGMKVELEQPVTVRFK